jgi:hypothetical protein
MFQVIPGIPRGLNIVSPFRFSKDAGISMDLGGIYRRILVLQGRIHLLKQSYGNGVHQPAEFGLPQVPAPNQVQNPEKRRIGTMLDQSTDFISNTL